MSECRGAKKRKRVMDLYSLLEVSPSADIEEIKHAYRKLALMYHPDRNKGKEEECALKFKEVASAYTVLSDPEKRATYDKVALQLPQRKKRRQARFFHSSTDDLRKAFSRLVSSGVSFNDFFAGDSSSSFSDLAKAAAASRAAGPSSAAASPYSSRQPSPEQKAEEKEEDNDDDDDDDDASEKMRDEDDEDEDQLTGEEKEEELPTNSSYVSDKDDSHLDVNLTHGSRWLPKKGQTLQTTLHVSFEECVKGCTKTIELDCFDTCDQCRGLGYPVEIQPQLCGMCQGTGTYSQRSSLLTISTLCGACNGLGKKIDTPCSYCEEGRVSRKKRLAIDVPAGVVQGMRKIYEEEGDVGECGGSRGDLIVLFAVEESSQFTRQGDDAVTALPISFFQATLGDHIHIKGLLGQELRLTIPPGTQPGEVLALEGEGFPIVHSVPPSRGKLLAQVTLLIPRTLTLKQTQLLFKTQQKWDQP